MSERPRAVEVARAIERVQHLVGYDSIDRELAFTAAAEIFDYEYEDFYNAWLNGASTTPVTVWAALPEMSAEGSA